MNNHLALKQFLEKSLKFPCEIHLESSSKCNSRCVICPRDKMLRELGELDLELFRKAVEETPPYDLDYIHLHLNGEPLLLDIDNLVWRINYAKKLNPKTSICIFTNGSLLDDEKIDKIINSKLDIISISVDGGNKKDFETMRVGLLWDVVIRNVKKLVSKKKEVKSNLYIQTAIIPTKLNENSIEEYYKLFNDIGVDNCGGSGVLNIGGLIDSDSMRTKLQKYILDDLERPCWKLFIDLSIMSDGRACVCAQDVVGALPIGDLWTQTLKEIWQGLIMTGIRNKFVYGEKNRIPFCGPCDYMTGFVMPDFWKLSSKEWIEIYEDVKNREYRNI